MAAATPWRTRATTPVRCRLGSATKTSNTPFGTPSWHRIGLKTSGVDAAGNAGMHDPPGVGDENVGPRLVIAASSVPSLCGLLLARALPCAVARTHSKRRARIDLLDHHLGTAETAVSPNGEVSMRSLGGDEPRTRR